MKKYIIILGLFAMLICSTLTITATASEPTIRLPSGIVHVTPDHDSNKSWFDFTLSNVTPGYDITNGVYPGWCVQKYRLMNNGSNPVYIKSCYDPTLPQDFKNVSWDKINYIINHRQGKDKYSVQSAIWYFTDNTSISNDTGAQALVNDTLQNGPGYIPQSGDILAIPVIGYHALQSAFLELTIPIPGHFQGLVWNDLSKDGLQNTNEPGIQGVTVGLYQSNGTLIQQNTTNTKGYYSYANVPPGEYYLQFSLPTGYKFTLKNVGSDGTRDSDADLTTGKTILFTVSANESITGWDAGMYKQSGGTSPPPSNIPPKADAGGPYKGLIHSNITFNGSRSYDYDGRIISWHWTLGDGTNASGEIVTHAYNNPGIYTVTLTVTDNQIAQNTNTTKANITTGNHPPSAPVITGNTSGKKNILYQYTMVATDPDGNNLRYIINWGDGSQNITNLSASGHTIKIMHQWKTAGFYLIQGYAQDQYNANSTVSKKTITIDEKYVGDLGYLIDKNSDGIYDTFHSNATGRETSVNKQNNGNYLIDSNGKGTYNIEYNPATGETQSYKEQPPWFEYELVILAIVVILIVLILYLVSKRRSKK